MQVSKTPLQSTTLLYTAISTIGVVIAFLLTDEGFSAQVGGTTMLVLYIVDKMITGYLRTITKVPIVRKSNLDILNDESQADDDYTKDF